jgi:glycosyltransferase involved in cell wall biosynthesis
MAMQIKRNPRGYRFKYKHGPKTAKPKKRPAAPQVATLHRARDGRPLIVLDCPWNRLNVGWDILARRYARAMVEAGMDARLYPVMPDAGLQSEVSAEAAGMARTNDDHDAYVWSTCFHRPDVLIPCIRQVLDKKKRPRVFYTMFERLRATPAIAAYLNTLEGVWVPCTANENALREAGSTNVRWVPVPFFDDDALLRLPPPQNARTFYWIGAWEQRKAPENLIKAFMRAFRPGEARLVLKSATAQAGYPRAEQWIIANLQDPRAAENGWLPSNHYNWITVDRRVLSRAQMVNDIHGGGDVYVSASRGEGVDMPLFEAKLARRRVITTDSGGPRDFLGEDDILIPRTGEQPVPPTYQWEPTATQADYSLDALVEAMRRVHGEPLKSRVDWPRETFHSGNVGRLLRDWFAEMRARG